MLSYRHGFHAGNHADVFKHSLLALVTSSLTKKETPFCYFDTHAGAGQYPLDSEWAQTTGEAAAGIERLLGWLSGPPLDRPALPQVFLDYLAFEQTAYAAGKMYAGSAWVVHHFARAQDSLVLMELHNNEVAVLRDNVKATKWKNVHVHHRDGFAGLCALTPPRQPLPARGFVLIDPSYETEADYTTAAETVLNVLAKWRSGTIMVWYPLLDHRRSQIDSLRAVLKSASLNTLDVQLEVDSPDQAASRLYGSGMLVVQPPWKLAEELEVLLPFLAAQLGTAGRGRWSLQK